MRSYPLLVAGLTGSAFSTPLSQRQTNTTSAQSWDEIKPSPDLNWQSCFQNYTCARLTVPLDYASHNITGTATIAYIRQPATLNSSSAEDVLINPGGPGESGVDTIMSLGSDLAQIIGPQFNLIGFDPRGVGLSGPELSCFGSDPASQANMTAYQKEFIRPVDGKSEKDLRRQYALAEGFGKRCTEYNKGTDAKYANTVAVASDMLNYVEKAAVLKGCKAEDAKVNYYGVSYGTVLGSVFASLFPARVGLFLMDGVVDVPNYYQGTQSSNLLTADLAVEDFFKYCQLAGPDRCALWTPSVSAIANRTRAILETVRKSPISVSDASVVGFPDLVEYKHAVFILLSGMYSPLNNWPRVASIFRDLEMRNGTSATLFLGEASPTVVDVVPLIGGMDSIGQNRKNFVTFEKWAAHVKLSEDQSHWVGDAWAGIALAVKDLEITPPPSQQFNVSLLTSPINTHTPILFASNTHDPSTPLAGAQKMHGLFANSGILVQNAPGHVASLAAVSKCTVGYIRGYFATGELPPANTTCEVESVPFVTGN